jgi:hypothetical protein
MGMPFENPVVQNGTGSLVIPQIQSPNFTASISGWRISQDGSAEFNNLVIRGTFFGTNYIVSAGGIFFYSGTPAAGNLVISLAPAATTADPEGNAVQGGGLKIYGTGGQAAFLGLVGSVSQLIFATGASFEDSPANVASGTSGSGTSEVMQALFSGPKGSHAGQQDWVQILLQSGSNGSGGDAAGGLAYIDTSGTVSFPVSWGINGASVNGINLQEGTDPGAESLSPGSAFGAPPASGGTVAGSFGGSALSYMSAVRTSYNQTEAALADLINRYNSMRAELIAAGVLA